MTTETTTDRNGWPAQLDLDTNVLRVTFPNGRIGVYTPCFQCKGAGAVTASWGTVMYCTACSCTGRTLRTTIEPDAVLHPGLDRETYHRLYVAKFGTAAQVEETFRKVAR